jgi:small subunit ribosomal protein S7
MIQKKNLKNFFFNKQQKENKSKYLFLLKKKQKLYKIYYSFNFLILIYQKFINCIIKNGKKIIAYKIMENVCYTLSKYTNKDASIIILNTLLKCLPLIEIRKRFIGKNKKKRRLLLVPCIINNPKKSISLAIHWIIRGARKRYYKSFEKNLYNEILDTYKGLNSSESLKIFFENQKLIFENRSNIRLKW